MNGAHGETAAKLQLLPREQHITKLIKWWGVPLDLPMYIYVPHSNTMKKYEKHTQNSNTVQPIRLYQSFKRKKNINSPI